MFGHIFKHQITDLIIHNNDEFNAETSLEIYNRNMYANIMVLFQNLKHLKIVASSVNDYPPLLLYRLPSTTYFSSTLTVLCIYVFGLDDCISLLDGRLKQLTTFIVEIYGIIKHRLMSRNIVS
jgi:hypothetical protein